MIPFPLFLLGGLLVAAGFFYDLLLPSGAHFHFASELLTSAGPGVVCALFLAAGSFLSGGHRLGRTLFLILAVAEVLFGTWWALQSDGHSADEVLALWKAKSYLAFYLNLLLPAGIDTLVRIALAITFLMKRPFFCDLPPLSRWQDVSLKALAVCFLLQTLFSAVVLGQLTNAGGFK